MTITENGCIIKMQITDYGKIEKGDELMLNNLKAELVRKELEPELAVRNAIGCCRRTAKDKLKGIRDFTVPEAFKIVNTYFPDDEFSWEYLFESSSESTENKPA